MVLPTVAQAIKTFLDKNSAKSSKKLRIYVNWLHTFLGLPCLYSLTHGGVMAQLNLVGVKSFTLTAIKNTSSCPHSEVMKGQAQCW